MEKERKKLFSAVFSAKIGKFVGKLAGGLSGVPFGHTIGQQFMEDTMFEIQDIDPVLTAVKRAIRQLGFAADGPMGQQILLLGDAFYGYRFTEKDVTAVWSAADQTLIVFDQHGKRLGTSLVGVPKAAMIENQGTIRLPEPSKTRKAA